jgi:hypothetical protein
LAPNSSEDDFLSPQQHLLNLIASILASDLCLFGLAGQMAFTSGVLHHFPPPARPFLNCQYARASSGTLAFGIPIANFVKSFVEETLMFQQKCVDSLVSGMPPLHDD